MPCHGIKEPNAIYEWSTAVTNSATVSGLCRVSVRAPESGFDLTVPTDVRIADLLPTIVGYAGTDLDETGLDNGGWVLQRLGGEPFDDESTVDGLGLHDGDVLYLRPRRAALPPIHFDDLVDGVASTLRERADSWRPELSRRLLVGFVLALLGACFAVLVLPGRAELRAGAAALIAVLLLAGSASASRAVGDRGFGTILATASIPYVALAAALLPSGSGPDLFGAQLLAGGAAGVGAAAVAIAVAGSSAPLFLSVAAVSLLTTLGGLAMVLFGLPVGHAVAAVSVFVVVLGIFVPAMAFRLSGLRLPPLPSNAEQLQEGIEPHDATNVVSRTAVTEQYVTALYLALGALYTACLTGLATSAGWPEYATIGALSALALLHGRSFGGIIQRLAVQLPGAYGTVLLAVLIAGSLAPNVRLAVVAVLLLLAAGLAVASWTIPGKRLLPHWGRVADIAHSVAAISVLPLVLLVFGVYHLLRTI